VHYLRFIKNISAPHSAGGVQVPTLNRTTITWSLIRKSFAGHCKPYQKGLNIPVLLGKYSGIDSGLFRFIPDIPGLFQRKLYVPKSNILKSCGKCAKKIG
jgi:hypothetical protein